jgi:hypothetical protein
LTKRKLEIAINLEEIFDKIYLWMKFCVVFNLIQIFPKQRSKEDITWDVFREVMERVGTTCSMKNLRGVFDVYSSYHEHGDYLDFDKFANEYDQEFRHLE